MINSCIFYCILLYESLYMISKDLYLEIISLHRQKASPYAIAKELKINYRTAKRYVEAHEAIVAEITESLYSCIFTNSAQNDESLQNSA